MRTKESDMRAAILISGSGTTMESIIRATQEGKVKHVVPVVVIADRPDTEGKEKAEALGVPVEGVFRSDFEKGPSGLDAFGEALLAKLKKYGVDYIGQHGWLSYTPNNVTSEFPGLNQHNGPTDPGRGDGPDDWSHDFGGHKMYGARVVASRLGYSWITDSDYWTESTVHHLQGGFDSGNLISVEKFYYDVHELPRPVTIATLRENPIYLKYRTKEVWKGKNGLLELEHKNVVGVYQMLGEDGIGSLPSWQRPKPLIPFEHKPVVEQVKNLAVKMYPPEK